MIDIVPLRTTASFFYRCQPTYSKGYMGRQNTYNIQKYFDGEEEGRRGGE